MSKKKFIGCTIKELPDDLLLSAAHQAIDVMPGNAPAKSRAAGLISVETQKFWGSRASDLTIGFMEQTSVAMRDKVLAVANRWGEFSSARFRWTQTNPIIRISFGPGGYWSYLGTDALSIPANQQTMNLQGFTTRTPESEWLRVVTHEFGHALGCPHEQQRKAILDLLDERKVIAYFKRTQNWNEQTVRNQILIPLEEWSLMGGSSPADQASIMCYSFPGSVTKSGQPILGGNDFSPIDRTYFAKIYPPVVVPPPPPPVGAEPAGIWLVDATGAVISKFRLQPAG